MVFLLGACSSETPPAKVNQAPARTTAPQTPAPVAKAAPVGDEAPASKTKTEATEPATESPEEEVAAAKEETLIPEEELTKARAILASVKEEDIQAVNAKKKYKMYCATCHGFTGNLNVNGAKDLTKSVLRIEGSVAQIYHGRGLMTPFKGLMTEAEIVAVARYIEKNLRK